MWALRLSDLRHRWPQQSLGLHVADVQLAQARHLFIHGPSGCGKTTLLRVVAYDGLYQNSYMGKPLSIRFLKPQTIDWGNPGTVRFGDTVTLKVTSSSALPVSVSVVSGPATLAGDTLKATGTGEVVLRAEQSGNANYEAISEVRSFKVAKAEQTLTVPTIANRAFNPQPFTPSAVAAVVMMSAACF